MRAITALLLLTTGCAWISDKELSGRLDADGDGVDSVRFGGADCDDDDATVHPDAAELCNERDDNCDGQTDEGAGTTWFLDADADGYGDTANALTACTQPAGAAAVDGDCDEGDAAIHPGGEDILCDGIDQDCDGLEDDAAGYPWYGDGDGDGYGDPDDVIYACTLPEGAVNNADDCNDAVAAITGPETWYIDEDGDGYGATETTTACTLPDGYADDSTDCDDGAADVHPDAPDACGDTIDQNCDGDDRTCRYTGSLPTTSAEVSYKPSTGAAIIAGSTAAAGDLNGDGTLDVVVGAPYASNGPSANAGQVWVDFSPPRTAAVTLGASGQQVVLGAGATHYLGAGLAIGDMDGDGQADLALGGYGEIVTAGGRVDLLYGPLSGGTLDLKASAADATHSGTSTSQEGYNLALLPDSHGDAVIIAGAPGTSRLILLRNPRSGAFDWRDSLIGDSGSQLGRSVQDVGDTDGDGLHEVGVGARKHIDADSTGSTEVGAAWVINIDDLPAEEDRAIADFKDDRVTGVVALTQFGNTVAPAGDLNGDGHDDVLVAEPNYEPSPSAGKLGRVWIFYGPWEKGTASTRSTTTLYGSIGGGNIGWDMSGVGDADEDGHGDLAIGEPVATGGEGAVHLLYGPFSGTLDLSTTSHATFVGAGPTDYLGNAVEAKGDITGDGVPDLLVGATGADTRGGVYLFPLQPL